MAFQHLSQTASCSAVAKQLGPLPLGSCAASAGDDTECGAMSEPLSSLTDFMPISRPLATICPIHKPAHATCIRAMERVKWK